MAAVSVTGEAFSDIRYSRLAKAAGFVDARHARGVMLELWHQCLIEQTYVLSFDDVNHVIGCNGVAALVASNLGEIVGEGVRIKGTKGRIEWLDKLRKNKKFGKLGGRPSKTLVGYPVQTHEGGKKITPSVSSSVLKEINKEKSKAHPLPASWEPNETHKQIAEDERVSLERECERFKGWALAKGQKYKNWDQAFCNWLKNDQFRKPQDSTLPNGAGTNPYKLLVLPGDGA